MSETKARLSGAIPVTTEAAAWAAIPEEAPDEVDLQMIRSAQADPDCQSFVASIAVSVD